MNRPPPPVRPDSDIPPMRLEDIHGALRGDFRRPWGGAFLLVLLLLLGLLYVLSSGPGPGGKTDGAPGDTGASGTSVPIIDPRRREEDLTQQLLQNITANSGETEAPTPADVQLGPVPAGHVRVAAVQIYSVFGDPERNRDRLKGVLEKAAAQHVQIVVLPEGAVPGYADATENRYWTKGKPAAKHFKVESRTEEQEEKTVQYYAVTDPEEDIYFELYDVKSVAEPQAGTSVRFFGELARQHGMYITVPFIEAAGDDYYSAVTLVGPDGKPVLHARKQQLWETGDGYWAKADTAAPIVAETPYGRIGVSFSYGIHRLSQFAQQKAHLVLQCSALYGQDFESIFLSPKYIGAIKQAGFVLVIANWTYHYTPPWEGYGMSRIILSDGRTRRIRIDDKDGMVIADVPCPQPAGSPKP